MKDEPYPVNVAQIKECTAGGDDDGILLYESSVDQIDLAIVEVPAIKSDLACRQFVERTRADAHLVRSKRDPDRSVDLREHVYKLADGLLRVAWHNVSGFKSCKIFLCKAGADQSLVDPDNCTLQMTQ